VSKFPAQTSYFSIQTFLSTNTVTETSIALDIVKQYYDNKELSGENTRLITIEGYGDFISFDELCLGLWMVFDKLYWGFPQEVQESVGISRMGWNGTVTDPEIDIPMALKMFNDLSKPATDYDEKFTRMQTFEKWFYKEGTKFIDYESYDELNNLNPFFYNWIETKLIELETLINSRPDILNKVSRDYIFDLAPRPKFFDTEYTPSDSEIGLLNEALILGNQFYLSFLTVLEQILYSFTRKIFPLKIYATYTYLYKEYLNIIVNFVKPYHAFNIDTSPIFKIGNDLDESIAIGDSIKKILIKQISTGVIYKLFDETPAVPDTYDSLQNIREQIKKEIKPHIETQLYMDFRLDDSENILVFDNNKEILTEELRIFKTDYYKKTYTGTYPSSWKFHVPEMNKLDDEEDYLSYLSWDHTTDTVANMWDRDVILIGRDKFYVGEDYTISSISVNADSNVRYALNFDFVQRPPHYDNQNIDGLSNCWCYDSVLGWFRKQLPYLYNFTNFRYVVKILESGDILDMAEFMDETDLESITTTPHNIRWIRPVIYLPIGSSFTDLEIKIHSKQKIYPVGFKYDSWVPWIRDPNLDSDTYVASTNYYYLEWFTLEDTFMFDSTNKLYHSYGWTPYTMYTTQYDPDLGSLTQLGSTDGHVYDGCIDKYDNGYFARHGILYITTPDYLTTIENGTFDPLNDVNIDDRVRSIEIYPDDPAKPELYDEYATIGSVSPNGEYIFGKRPGSLVNETDVNILTSDGTLIAYCNLTFSNIENCCRQDVFGFDDGTFAALGMQLTQLGMYGMEAYTNTIIERFDSSGTSLGYVTIPIPEGNTHFYGYHGSSRDFNGNCYVAVSAFNYDTDEWADYYTVYVYKIKFENNTLQTPILIYTSTTESLDDEQQQPTALTINNNTGDVVLAAFVTGGGTQAVRLIFLEPQNI
jgi:hypothetical protein